MLRLKEVLATLSLGQADLARAMKLSPAAIAQLVNHDQWPKSIDKQELWGRMADWLYDVGAQDGDIAALEEEVESPRANAATPA
ncbi:AAA family ATPase, partial [Pseudomonas aeruginosa]